jgi:adenylate cyclase
MSAEPARILVVDDEDNNRYTLVRRLRREGYGNVVTAENGQEALALLASQPFDLVLLDIMMPEVNGYEVLERRKADEQWRHIPVIMISALSELDSIVRCIELGAEDYLPKPFNPVLLRARIGACLERKHLRDREQAHLAEIEKQRRRADDLLDAILPASAVAELKTTGYIRPRRFDSVAVLFVDLVGFTAWCNSHTPEDVVADLQLLTEIFERLTTQHGLEKIKTVGDAFMATGNLLHPNSDPVFAAVRCAHDMAMAAHASPNCWRIRAGIHFGRVVAGAVGRTKFTFDLWGDTVNVAAHLSALGTDEAIYLSADAAARIGSSALRSMGHVALKAKSTIEVFRYEA